MLKIFKHVIITIVLKEINQLMTAPLNMSFDKVQNIF